MSSRIMIEKPKYKLYKKKVYEPVLLECINCSSFFVKKGGGFSAPKSESRGECDAIGKNGYYNIDFKCLVSEDGAENANEASLTEQTLCEGVTSIAPSKASMSGIPSLPFPSIWGLSVNGSLYLNENSEIDVKDEDRPLMKKTIISLNRTICKKKNLLFFFPNRLVIEDSDDIEILCSRAREAFDIITRAREKLSHGYDTFYALWFNSDKMVLLSDGFNLVDCIELTTLDSWRKVLRDYCWC